MLNEKEKEGCRQMLNKLNLQELLSLADTVTRKQITVTGKTEAILAILTYTEEPVELMRRRKMKREILFQYLVDCHVVFKVSADKKELIQEILRYWGVVAVDLQDMDVDVSDESINSDPKPGTSTVTQGAQTPNGQISPVGIQTDTPRTQSQSSSANLQYSNGYSHPTHASNHIDTGQYVPQRPLLSHGDTDQTANFNRSHTDPTIQALGEQFARWFYEMLNSFNPTVAGTAKDFGPHHFWDDAKIRIVSVTPSPSTEEYVGPQLVADRLISFTKEEQLLFNPNIGQDGLFVKSSRHGLVMILVCGTIHRSNECLGVFQQVFGIIKDPRFNDNWKIKVTYLDVKSSQVTAMPKLEGNVETLVNSLIPV